MNDIERALLKACHHALIALRARAQTASPEEVAGVTDALELVVIKLWSGEATGDHLLLESELASIARRFEGYDGASLFALDSAGERARHRALFEQWLTSSYGPLPSWALDRIRQAGSEEIERYQDQYVEVLREKMSGQEEVGGLERVLR